MSEAPWTIFRRLPAPVKLLIYGTFVNRAGGFILPFLAIVLTRDFGLNEKQLASILACYGIGSLCAILTGGWLTDRIGRRQVLLTSLIGGGSLAVAMGFSRDITILSGLILVYGFVGELYRPAASAILGDLLPSSQRAVGFAALRLAVNLGFAFGTGLGGFLADAGWRLIFWGDGATTLAFAALMFFGIPETRPVSEPPHKDAPRVSISPWRDLVFFRLILCSFAFSLVFFTHITVLPLTVTKSAGYSAKLYGGLIALNCLIIAVIEMTATQWLMRWRRLRVAALGYLFMGAGFALTGLFMHWAWFAFTVIIWTAGEILVSPQQMAFIADWSPPAARGRYLSLFQASWSLAFAATPLVFLPLHARLPEAWFWPLTLVIAVPPFFLLRRIDKVDHPDRLRGATGT